MVRERNTINEPKHTAESSSIMSEENIWEFGECSHFGCDNPAESDGYCLNHYKDE